MTDNNTYINNKINNNSKKVLLGMSGGVDSSAALLMLQEKGFEVIGLTFVQDNTCSKSQQAAEDAALVAKRFNIEHHILDVANEFRGSVIQSFIDEYLRGRTPNPCAFCNRNMKFKVLLDFANKANINFIATGHYANIRFDENYKRYVIHKAKDEKKDQTYFLWGLTQEQLSRIIFPLGNLLKTEIREYATEHNIPVQNKPDSQEICFIPDNDYRKFLVDNVETKIEKPGDFMFRGQKKGRHNGFPFYTVGQRKGLGLSHSEPLFVKSIDPENNIINLETIDNIADSRIRASNINFIDESIIQADSEFIAKIRYRDPGTPAKCEIKDGKLFVEFLSPKNSIALGQSLVIYKDDDLLGGGVIDSIDF